MNRAQGAPSGRDPDGVAVGGFKRGHPFWHHMFGKKCEAFFVEHMQRASAAPRITRITAKYAQTLQSPSNYSDRASHILQSTAELSQERILVLKMTTSQPKCQMI